MSLQQKLAGEEHLAYTVAAETQPLCFSNQPKGQKSAGYYGKGSRKKRVIREGKSKTSLSQKSLEVRGIFEGVNGR